MTGFMNKKRKLCCHLHQIDETFHLICLVLICLIQFIMPENADSRLRKIWQIKEAIYVTKVMKHIQHFICMFTCYFI